MKTKIKLDRRGDGIVQHAFFVILAFVIIVLFLTVAPVCVKKQQLDTYANEICRTAAISGRIGKETDERSQELKNQTGLTPEITWSTKGNVQLGQTITVTLKMKYDIGFGGLGSYPISLVSKSSDKSEVYWK